MTLYERFIKEIHSQLMEKLGIKNPMSVPKLTKIVLNIGLGEALADHKVIERAVEQLTVISGQKPVVMKAKVSISTFKLRAGDKVGAKVTLRNKKMYDFLDKLLRVVLPRIRDFRGLSKDSFDGQGNYTIGLAEQILFPEIDYAKIDKVRGLEVTFVTTAKTDVDGLALLEALGIPFESEEERTRKSKT